jgi:SAM-dependent methyltransferase
MRYVICLRDPLSVARSLEERDGFGIRRSGRLWLSYTAAALANTAGANRLLVFYDDLVNDPSSQIERLASFLGCQEVTREAAAREAAASFIDPGLSHHREGAQAVAGETALPTAARLLYLLLRSIIPRGVDGPAGVHQSEQAINAVASVLQFARAIDGADPDGVELMGAEIERLRQRLAPLEAQARALNVTRRELARITSHPVWRAYTASRAVLVPEGSRRAALYRWARSGARAVARHGAGQPRAGALDTATRETPVVEMSFLALRPRLNTTIAANDSLYRAFTRYSSGDLYFVGGLRVLDEIQALLLRHSGKRLVDCWSIGDYACHYGRLLRCLRVAVSNARLCAYDIDRDALDFCRREFHCETVHVGWDPESLGITADHALLLCLSLVTHTRREFVRRLLGAWSRVVAPGGYVFFTYLGPSHLAKWLAGQMPQYGSYSQAAIQRVELDFERHGHAYSGLKTRYSATDDYGIAFLSDAVVREDVDASSAFDMVELVSGTDTAFGQDVAILRRR